MMEKDRIVYIVFATDHYNALGIIRSLGEDNIPVNAILIKSKRKCAVRSKYIVTLEEVENVEKGYLVLLNKFNRTDVQYAILMGDDIVVSYLDSHYDEIKDKYIFFNAGCNGRLTKCMDKKYIGDIARTVGFDVPKTWAVNKGVIPSDIQYPIITKSESPIGGGWKADVYVCSNSEELINAYNKIQSNIVVLQQYIKKENELALQGYSSDDGKTVYISVETKNKDLLPDKYCSYIEVYKFKNDELLDKCIRLLTEIRYNGVFEIEFLIQGNDLYFLEVNFRNTAFNYASKYAGANLNKIWPEAMCLHERVMDHVVDDDLHFMVMAEPQDFRDRVKTKKITLFKWIHDLLTCECWFYFNKHDLKPFFSYWMSKFI